MKALIYTRVSTKEQVSNRQSNCHDAGGDCAKVAALKKPPDLFTKLLYDGV
jgi:DNA invertase Pin-like site-specific DNA recombinase